MEKWLLEVLNNLANFQFSEEGLEYYDQSLIEFIESSDFDRCLEKKIYIFLGSTTSCPPKEIKDIDFSGTKIKCWNKLDKPSKDWQAIPNEDKPIWYVNEEGALTPAWDFFYNLLSVLTFAEESGDNNDIHDRFAPENSYRSAGDLHQSPIVNEFNSILLDAFIGIKQGELPKFDLDSHYIRPLSLGLSHDLDQLSARDIYTLSSKLLKIIKSLISLNFYTFFLLVKSFVVQIFFPEKYYIGNLLKLINLEKKYNFSSVCYFLVGKKGRLGRRSSLKLVSKVSKLIQSDCEIGVHYNYWSSKDPFILKQEIDLIESLSKAKIESGRAHYLTFNPNGGFALLEQANIKFDESVGWGSILGFKAGIAGPFRPYSNSKNMGLIENPLFLMDTIVQEDEKLVQKMISHLEKLGGMVTLVIHPDANFYPENFGNFEKYERFLAYFSNKGSRSWLPSQIIDQFKEPNS